MSVAVRLAWALTAAVAVQACAQQASAPLAGAGAPLSKTTWTVARAGCPAGCSTPLQVVLTSLVGGPVQLSPTQLTASFIDPCEGQVHLELKPTPVADIVADVNKGRAPGRKQLAVADLGASGTPLSGWALCRGAKGDLNLQRLLVVAPDRIVLLSQEQSLIELR